MTAQTNKSKKLFRSEKDRMLGGVAAGLGEYFNIDPTIVRLVFVLITIVWGTGIVLYFILWLIIPTESKIEVISEDSINGNLDEIKNRVEELAEDIKGLKKQKTSKK